MALFVTNGCQIQHSERQTYNVITKKSEKYTNAESLLSSKGCWEFIEDKKELSPLEQHMKARLKVDPKHVKSGGTYINSKNMLGNTSHFRILRLDSSQFLDGIILPVRKPVRGSKEFMTAKSTFIDSCLKSKFVFAKKPIHNIANKLSALESVVGVSVIKNVRIGEHPEKIRFVLDMTGSSDFSYELNNKKGYLLIDLPNTKWTASKKEIFQFYSLITGYSVRSYRNGTKLFIALKKPGRLITSVSLPSNDEYGYRIYFDIGDAK